MNKACELFLERQRKTPKNGSLLFVNDHFWGERNAVIGVFLVTRTNVLPSVHVINPRFYQ